jgi:hypothetical protein
MLTPIQQVILYCLFIAPEDPRGFEKYKNSQKAKKYARAHPDRKAATWKRWADNNPEKIKQRQSEQRQQYADLTPEEKRQVSNYRVQQLRIRQYGLTPNQIEVRIIEQNGQCAICKNLFIKTPHVDHNHKTGKVRGLLCGQCNTGIGHLQDSPKICFLAAEYLYDNR